MNLAERAEAAKEEWAVEWAADVVADAARAMADVVAETAEDAMSADGAAAAVAVLETGCDVWLRAAEASSKEWHRETTERGERP